jgi:hypothetical protein
MAGHVDDDGGVAALAGEARAAAAGQDRDRSLVADPHGFDDVFAGSGNDDTDRNLPVVRGIRGVESPAARTEVHLTRNPPAQLVFERSCVGG